MIFHMMLPQNKNMSAVVLRKFIATHKGSTYPAIKKAILQIQNEAGWVGFEKLWTFVKSPVPIITFKPTGQVIRFGGYDNATSLSSISLDNADHYFGYV
jgi:phage terminase large subunit